jgi:hypothetical protein
METISQWRGHLVGPLKQGDQIGRIFTFWPIVYIGQVFLLQEQPQFWASFPHKICHALILAKNLLRYILGDFFTNSSGHPALKLRNCNFVPRNSKRGGMATHAGVALELGIVRPSRDRFYKTPFRPKTFAENFYPQIFHNFQSEKEHLSDYFEQ